MLGTKLNVTITIGAISAVIGVLNYNYDATPKVNNVPTQEQASADGKKKKADDV